MTGSESPSLGSYERLMCLAEDGISRRELNRSVPGVGIEKRRNAVVVRAMPRMGEDRRLVAHYPGPLRGTAQNRRSTVDVGWCKVGCRCLFFSCMGWEGLGFASGKDALKAIVVLACILGQAVLPHGERKPISITP